MDIYAPIIQEFIARKEHILNLETRLFVLTFIIQIIFLLFIYLKQNESKKNILPWLSIPFFFFLFESIAINGKMGLISNYLKQLEAFLNNQGFVHTVWESKALEQIIFPFGNAFTLPASLAILILLLESFYILKVLSSLLISSELKQKLVTIILFIVLVLITVKSLTVDFFTELPNLFNSYLSTKF